MHVWSVVTELLLHGYAGLEKYVGLCSFQFSLLALYHHFQVVHIKKIFENKTQLGLPKAVDKHWYVIIFRLLFLEDEDWTDASGRI